MKLRSLYEFFRVYFSYVSKGNKWYALAINDTMKIIRETVNVKNAVPIIKYLNSAQVNPVAKKMLEKFAVLACTNYKNPFNDILYFKTYVKIDRSDLTSNHRGIEIPIECGIDSKENKLIILVFSSRYNITEEVKALKGLFKEFKTDKLIPINISKVAYWNLSKGEEDVVDYENMIPAGKSLLIDAVNKI